jgi:hypothetical protein
MTSVHHKESDSSCKTQPSSSCGGDGHEETADEMTSRGQRSGHIPDVKHGRRADNAADLLRCHWSLRLHAPAPELQLSSISVDGKLRHPQLTDGSTDTTRLLASEPRSERDPTPEPHEHSLTRSHDSMIVTHTTHSLAANAPSGLYCYVKLLYICIVAFIGSCSL